MFVSVFKLGKVYGVETYVLTPEESKKIYPLMNIDDLYGTMYSPGDGTIDPSSWTAALGKGARMRGAKVLLALCDFIPVLRFLDQNRKG